MQTQADQTETPCIGRAAFCLFVALVCFYLLLARGRVTSIDEWHVYGTTESLVERGSWQLELPGSEPQPDLPEGPGPKERTYSRYSVVPSLVGVPFCKLAQTLVDWLSLSNDTEVGSGGLARDKAELPRATRRDILQAATTLETPFVTALTAMTLFVGLCRLSIDRGAALAAAIVYALCTLSVPYSGSLYVQPVAALALTSVLLGAALGADVWTGVAMAFLLAIRLEFALLLPVLTLHIWRSGRPIARSSIGLIFGAGVGVGLNMIVNSCRGDPLLLGDYGGEAFSTSIWIGLHGLLLSAGKGLVFFAPVAAVGLVLIPWLMNTEPRVGFLVSGTSITILVMVACWWTWHGGWSWGPRLLVPIMPVLVLPCAWVFDRWQQLGDGLRVLLVAIVIASFAIQVWAALTDPVADRSTVLPPIAGNENESIYVPQVGPWGVAAAAGPDVLWWRLWRAEPTWRHALLAIVITLLVAAGAFGWFTLRSLRLDMSRLSRLIPELRPAELFTLALGLLLLAAPKMLESWLLRDETSVDSASRERWPRHLRRFQPDGTGLRLAGKIFIPIKGDYTFYQQGPPGTQFYADGRPVFHGAPGEFGSTISALEPGLHRLDVESGAAGHFNTLYWSTPGYAHYREPVPRVYMVSPSASWRERLAIRLELGRWFVWLCVAIAMLFLWAGSRNKANR